MEDPLVTPLVGNAHRKSRLEAMIFAAFEHAHLQGRIEVAEHLLQALEALAAEDSADEDDLLTHGPLGAAYARIARIGRDG